LRLIKKQTAVKQSYKSIFIIVLTIIVALPLAAFSIYSYKNYQSEWSLIISGTTIPSKGRRLSGGSQPCEPG
jgi:hypothetical protein